MIGNGSRRGFGLRVVVGLVMLFTAAACGAAVSDSAAPAPTGTTAGGRAFVGPAGACGGKQPCFPDLSSAIAAVSAGAVITVLAGTYQLPTPKSPTEPAVLVDKAVTITGQADSDSDSCPAARSACPTLELPDGASLGIQVGADNITISNLTIDQKTPPGSDYAAALVYAPIASGGGLAKGLKLDHLALNGGRRAVWLNAQDATISDSQFANQASDSVFVAAATGSTTIKGNSFGSGGKGKDINFEAQQGSPPTTGSIEITGNSSFQKSNFFLWNTWPAAADLGSVSLRLDHNTVVGTSGAAVVWLPGQAGGSGFGVFKDVSVTNTIVQGAGGDAVLLDYRYSPADAAVPAPGLIAVSNMLTYQNVPSGGANDPTGNFGISANAPAAASLGVFSIAAATNINGRDPQLADPAKGDFSLAAGSPAIGAGSAGTDVGAWQGGGPAPGAKPVVSKVSPLCGKDNSPATVTGRRFTPSAAVAFGAVPASVTKFRAGKRRDRLVVEVPDIPFGWSDVTVTTAAGSATKRHAFFNRSGVGCPVD